MANMHLKTVVVLLGFLCLAEAGKYWNSNAVELLKKAFEEEKTEHVYASGEAPEERGHVYASGEAPEERVHVYASGEAPEERGHVYASGEAPEERGHVYASGEAPEEKKDLEPNCCKTKNCGYQERKKCQKPERTITQMPKCCMGGGRSCDRNIQCPQTKDEQVERSERRQLEKIFRQLETLLLSKRKR